MSKKIVMFLVLIISALSIMGIAIFGTLPESGSSVRITDIIITNEYDIRTDDGLRYKDLRGIVTESELTYVIHYEIEPEIANKDSIRVSSSDSNIASVIHDMEAQIVEVTFQPGTINKLGSTVIIRIWCSDTQKQSRLALGFLAPGEVDDDDHEFSRDTRHMKHAIITFMS